MASQPIPNIGPAGIRYRAKWGTALLAASLLLAFLFIVADWPRLLRLVLLVPLYGAGLGIFQAKEKT